LQEAVSLKTPLAGSRGDRETTTAEQRYKGN